MIERLAEQLSRPDPQLPGAAAQFRMAHGGRQDVPPPPEDARRAAVLALLHPLGGDTHLLFIQRTSPPGDRHGGQISFPGGSAEPADESPAFTALRETEEEVGVPAGDVRLLGELTPLYIPVSNFLVNVFVGYADPLPALRPQASEVARTLQLPLAAFADPANRRLLDRKLPGGLLLREVPHYVVNGEEIWGATAMMVSELVAVGR